MLDIHELMTTLQEDGTCHLTHKDGEVIELNLSKDIVTKALRLKEENNPLNFRKLLATNRHLTFKMDKAGEGIYDALRE